jgi:hypothetical protein
MSGPFTSPVAKAIPFDSTGLDWAAGDVQAALQELKSNPSWNQRSQATSLNGTLTLAFADSSLQFLTGTATGYSVVMPSALTLFLSAFYQIINLSSQNVTIKDNSGATLFVLSQQSAGFLILQTQPNAAGTWVWWQLSTNAAQGVASYQVSSATSFASSANTDTLVTGMTVTPQAGTYAVWYDGEATGSGSGQQLDVTVYKGGSAITDSKRSGLSTSGTHIFSTTTLAITQFNGTQACEIRVNPNGNSFTINQRSMLLIRLGT